LFEAIPRNRIERSTKMNLIDLELFRWKWFHEVLMKKTITQKRKIMAKQSGDLKFFWKEDGAFVSTLPRQSGKTDMLIRLSRIFDGSETSEKYIVIVDNFKMKENLVNRGFNKNYVFTKYMFENDIRGKNMPPEEYNLMIEEYQRFGTTLDDILGLPWKSVTMVGTLR
jgi:hypothetical protein